jgi:aspartyl protease family protein
VKKIPLLLLFLSLPLFAAERVSVLALFPGKAMLEIDGQRKVLSEGQRHASGVRLITANSREARIELNGREQVLTLGTAVSASYVQPTSEEIRLIRSDNAYFIDGLINGQAQRMLVDTGATLVAISETEARRLGIPYVLEGEQMGVRTASGQVRGYGVILKSLKIGSRTFNRVKAVVVEGDNPHFVLLGMNVLQHFEIEQQRNLMILRTRN